MAQYKLPATFALDWLNRTPIFGDVECSKLTERVVKHSGNIVTLELTDDEVFDLLGDAQFYADTSGDYWDESVRHLCRSAQRVVAALEKQEVA